MDAIEFPIKLSKSGLSRLTDGSPEYYRQILALSAITEPYSLPITPDFGIWDPTFNTVEKGQFVLHAARFVPEVEIGQIDSLIDDSGQNIISFSFSVRN